MSVLFWRGQSVLVVGAVHVDTIAEREDSETIDVPGEVVQSIGGGAYNLAVNLGIHRHWRDGTIYLWSFVPKKSALTATIRSKLRTLRVSTWHMKFKDVFDKQDIALGGFVGVRSSTTRDMIKAATQTAIEEINPFAVKSYEKRFLSALQDACCVVVDTNTHPEAIHRICALTANAGKPLFVSIVSEKKAMKHAELFKKTPPPSRHAYFVSGRPKEVCQILRSHPQSDKAKIDAYLAAVEARQKTFDITPREICAWANASHVIVTPHRGSDCCFLFSASDTSMHFDPTLTDPPAKGNYTGLGDAIHAAVVQYFSRKPKEFRDRLPSLDLNDVNVQKGIIDTVQKFTSNVLRSPGATPLAVISYLEKDVPIPLHLKITRAGKACYKIAKDYSWLLVSIGWILLFWYGFKIAWWCPQP